MHRDSAIITDRWFVTILNCGEYKRSNDKSWSSERLRHRDPILPREGYLHQTERWSSGP